MNSIRTCLWFNGNGHEAADFYVSLLPGSAVESRFGAIESGAPLMVNFHLGGVPYQVLNGGPQHPLSHAVSISVTTEDQAETDRLWDALTADGGAEVQCGWLTDRFGLSWQIVPHGVMAYLGGPDADGAARATQAMLTMRKLDLAAIEAAYRG